MNTSKKHLVFYDGTCGLCDHVVQLVLRFDDQENFIFAPLQGETARAMNLPQDEDSLVLIENYGTDDSHLYLMGEGAFRILWLLGGPFYLIGWPFFLPAFLYNWGYRLVARNRKRFFPVDRCKLPKSSMKDRFLP